MSGRGACAKCGESAACWCDNSRCQRPGCGHLKSSHEGNACLVVDQGARCHCLGFVSECQSSPLTPAERALAQRAMESLLPRIAAWLELYERDLAAAEARAVRCEGVVPSKELLCRADGLLSLIYHRYRYEKIPDDVREDMLQTSYALRAITDRLP